MATGGPFLWESYDGVLFDLDGVLTPTAELHRRAWRAMFDELFAIQVPPQEPFTDAEYFEHVDGRPRLDGVRSVLAARGLTLPDGAADDTADRATVHGRGAHKQSLFRDALRRDGVTPFAGAVRVLDHLAAHRIPCGVVSASRNAREVLRAARLDDRFVVVVDGEVAAEHHLSGKPAPDTFLEGARRLGVPPQRCVAVEDAIAGIAGAAAGKFGCIIGVDRGTGSAALLEAGADLVVTDLTDTLPEPLGGHDRRHDGTP